MCGGGGVAAWVGSKLGSGKSFDRCPLERYVCTFHFCFNLLSFLWPHVFLVLKYSRGTKEVFVKKKKKKRYIYIYKYRNLWFVIWILWLLLLYECLSHQDLIKVPPGSEGPDSGYCSVSNLCLHPAGSPGLQLLPGGETRTEEERAPTLPKEAGQTPK